jgi:hypothetical protein
MKNKSKYTLDKAERDDLKDEMTLKEEFNQTRRNEEQRTPTSSFYSAVG